MKSYECREGLKGTLVCYVVILVNVVTPGQREGREGREEGSQSREREKKQKATQDTFRSLMANFFGKAKAPPRESPSKPVCGTSNSKSDFHQTFKLFVLKKDAEMAPINWFLKPCEPTWKQQTSDFTHADAIVVDDAQTFETNGVDVFIYHTPTFNHAEANAQGACIEARQFTSLILYTERLQDVIRLLRPLRPCDRSKSSFKSFSKCNTKDIFSAQ
jgi:hypothetical protein